MPGYIRAHGSRLIRGGRRGFGVGVTPTPPSGDTEVASITLKSNGGAWHGYQQVRLVFPKGAVTSGRVPYVKRSGSDVTAQFSARTTYDDGSLWHCVAFLRDSDWTAPETSRTLTYGHRTGSYTDSSAFALSDITSAHDFTITVDSCTAWDGTSSTARSSANGDADFNTASGTPANVQELCDGPVCTAWRVVDFVGTDTDLQTEFWVSAFKDGTGALSHVVLGPYMGQLKWKSTTKRRLDYNVTVKDGVTTLASWSTIQHPYHSGYMAVENRDHVMEGRGITVGATEAQVIPVYDWELWYGCGLLDAYDFTGSPTPNWTNRYIPLDDVDHRFGMGSGGAYMGRGMINGTDLQYCLLETFASARSMRCNALVGHHLPQRYRDDTKPMRTKSLILAGNDNPDSSYYDFTADGLSAPVHAYTTNGNPDSFGTVSGGTGSWTPEGGNAHLPDYSWFSWMVECDWWHLQAAIDNAAACIHIMSGDQYRALPTTLHFDGAAETLSGILWQDQVRGVGFALMIIAHAANGCPDGWPEKGYLTELALHNTNTMRRSIEGASTTLKNFGLWETRDLVSPWHEAFLGLGVAQCARLLEDADAEWMVKNFFSIVPSTMFANFSPYRLDSYRPMWYTMDVDSRVLNWDGGVNTTARPAGQLTWSSNNFSSTYVDTANNTLLFALVAPAISVGDKFRFATRYGVYTDAGIPGGCAWNKDYYIREIISSDHEGREVVATISETPGGAVVDLTSAPSQYAYVFIEVAEEVNYAYGTAPTSEHSEVTFPPFLPPENSTNYAFIADDYAQHQRANMVMANALGATAATDALCDFLENFSVNISRTSAMDYMWTYTRRAA